MVTAAPVVDLGEFSEQLLDICDTPLAWKAFLGQFDPETQLELLILLLQVKADGVQERMRKHVTEQREHARRMLDSGEFDGLIIDACDAVFDNLPTSEKQFSGIRSEAYVRALKCLQTWNPYRAKFSTYLRSQLVGLGNWAAYERNRSFGPESRRREPIINARRAIARTGDPSATLELDEVRSQFSAESRSVFDALRQVSADAVTAALRSRQPAAKLSTLLGLPKSQVQQFLRERSLLKLQAA